MRFKLIGLVAIIWLSLVSSAQAVGWELLGERSVRFTTDRDTISVTSSEGKFSKLKLKVLRNGIELLDVKVIFGDGTSQDLKIRRFIAAGSETRVLDLVGPARVIRKVELRYRSRAKHVKRAKVQLWGLQTGASSSAPKSAPPAATGTWELLGKRTVSFRADRDVIRVSGSEGTFRKIKLKVLNRRIKLLDLKVHFADGSTFDVSVRKTITAGSETRVIDLPGAARVISKVEMTYSPAERRRGKAEVHLWGKH
jgi:hypothetical protein